MDEAGGSGMLQEPGILQQGQAFVCSIEVKPCRGEELTNKCAIEIRLNFEKLEHLITKGQRDFVQSLWKITNVAVSR